MPVKTNKVTVYGWAIPEDRFRGQGSGTFVDLTYFVDGDITVEEILKVINDSGFKLQALKYPEGHPMAGMRVRDRVIIEEIKIGVEPVRYPEQPPSEPSGGVGFSTGGGNQEFTIENQFYGGEEE